MREFESDKVSIIIPVYNAERYLQKTLNSIYAQTYQNLQIVLVDDCSKDNSEEIIRENMSKCSEITYYRQITNLGAGNARNKALEIATGQYVAFLDSDDLWKTEKIEKQLRLMRNERTPFSYTAIEMIDRDGNLIKKKRKILTKCDYNILLKNTMIATSSVVIDRNALGDFRMSTRRGGQDYATWLRLLKGGAVARGIDESLVQYRVTDDSLSSNKFKSIQQVWNIQTQDEHINVFKATINVCGFILNALKKYLL